MAHDDAANVDEKSLLKREYRVAIVGGGLTGLTTAYRFQELARERGLLLKIVLFEANQRTGGVFGTQRIGDYLVELGADSFITNKPWALDLCLRLGLKDDLIPTNAEYRRSLVLRQGKPVPVPEGFQLLSPVEIWPILKSPLFSWPGKLRMAWEYFLPRKREPSDESLASFVRRRFGREALERLVQPMVGGIYTSDPELLSLQATMPRFLELEQKHGSVIRGLRVAASREMQQSAKASGARYGLFLTLRNGMQQLLDKLTESASQTAELRLGTSVTKLTPGTQGYLVESSSEGITHTEQFDRVLLALPTHRIAELVNPFDTTFANHLREIEYASTAIVVSGHKLADIKHPLDAFGLVIPASEKRRILAVSFTSRKFPNRAPEGHVELRTFVGGAMQPGLYKLSDEEIQRLVQDELRDLLGVEGTPDFTVIARYPRSMPQYHVGHLERVARIRQAVATHPGLYLAGNAYEGVGVPDSIHSAEQAAESLVNSLG